MDTALPVQAELNAITYDDFWIALVSSAVRVPHQRLVEWKEQAGALVLPTSMEHWSPKERRSFIAELNIPAVSVVKIGKFEASRLAGVPLVAESDAEAQRWADWLLWDGINEYVVPADINRARQAVVKHFPLHRPKLPDANELLQRARSSPKDRTARFILAPADLGLWS